MKLHPIVKACLMHAFILLLFIGIYYYLLNEFENVNKPNPVTFLDCVNLASTIQTTIGLSNIYPISKRANIAMIIQQFLTIPAILFSAYHVL